MSTLTHPRQNRPTHRQHAATPHTSNTSPFVIVVNFAAASGERWSAVGGGASLNEAIAYAHESCPPGTAWKAVGWEHLFAD